MGIHFQRVTVCKKLVFTGAVLLVLCFGVLAGVFLVFRSRGDKAVAIIPAEDHPVGNVAIYCQKDEAWKDDMLGDSYYRMGGSGCLTSCIASALSTEAEVWDTGEIITPGELNRLFGENQVYNAQGDIVWGQIKEALPKAGVAVASSVSEEEIEELLDKGHYPVVKVKVGGNGASHWVLLVGAENGTYMCMDPLSEDGELVPLSRHGGVVYRMRCVYWES